MIIATAGHVDHGKSSLVKRITGMETDNLAEEKTRGLSINLGFAYYHFQDHIIGFVDVPGHSDFINNMLAGVAAVDFALLVIAVDDGVMPQTREHLSILDLLGVSAGAVALSKIDSVEPARVEEVKKEVDELLASTVLANSPIFPLSNISGEGIPELLSFLQERALYYSAQPSFNTPALEGRNNVQIDDASREKFRFSIDRVFSVKGIGTVVTGTVVAGIVSLDDSFRHSASANIARIRDIRVHQNSIKKGLKGQRLALNISISHNLVHRGDWLLAEELLLPVQSFDAKIKLTNVKAEQIKSTVELHLHHFSSRRLAKIRVLNFEDMSLDKDSEVWVNVKLQNPLYCLSGDRFILRDASASETIGGGKVVDIFPPTRRKLDGVYYQYLHDYDLPFQSSLPALLESQEQGVNYSMFAASKNLYIDNENAIEGVIDENRESIKEIISTEDSIEPRSILLKGSGHFSKILLHLKYFRAFKEQITSTLQHYHTQCPDRQGMSEFNLMKNSGYSGTYNFFRVLLKKLCEVGLVAKTGTLIHINGHQAQLDRDDVILFKKLQIILSEAGITAPRTGELVDILKYDQKVLDTRLKELCERGYLVQVFKNRFYLLTTILEIAGIVEKLADEQKNKGFTVIQFRDESGIGRNLCIQLLEFFDRQGFTLRNGDRRIVRQIKEDVFSIPV
ncbi:selenocysteine-specific translation elongation factor [Aurantivibrio infirmus]